MYDVIILLDEDEQRTKKNPIFNCHNIVYVNKTAYLHHPERIVNSLKTYLLSLKEIRSIKLDKAFCTIELLSFIASNELCQKIYLDTTLTSEIYHILKDKRQLIVPDVQEQLHYQRNVYVDKKIQTKGILFKNKNLFDLKIAPEIHISKSLTSFDYDDLKKYKSYFSNLRNIAIDIDQIDLIPPIIENLSSIGYEDIRKSIFCNTKNDHLDMIKKLMPYQNHIRICYGQTYYDEKELFYFEDAITCSLADFKTLEEFMELYKGAIVSKSYSPLEQLIFIYEIIRNYHYCSEKEKGLEEEVSREPHQIVNGNYLVCHGYTRLVNYLCSKVGIRSLEYGLALYNPKLGKEGYHSRNMVYLNDEKYHINGIYILDPTWDRKENDVELNAYTYFLRTMGEFSHMNYIENINLGNFVFLDIEHLSLENSFSKNILKLYGKKINTFLNPVEKGEVYHAFSKQIARCQSGNFYSNFEQFYYDAIKNHQITKDNFMNIPQGLEIVNIYKLKKAIMDTPKIDGTTLANAVFYVRMKEKIYDEEILREEMDKFLKINSKLEKKLFLNNKGRMINNNEQMMTIDHDYVERSFVEHTEKTK